MNLLAGQGLSLGNSWYFGYVYSRHGDKIAMCRGIPQPAVCGSDAAVMEEVICPVWCWLCDGYYCLQNHPGRGCFGTSLCCRHMPRSCPVVRVVALFLWKLEGGRREVRNRMVSPLAAGLLLLTGLWVRSDWSCFQMCSKLEWPGLAKAEQTFADTAASEGGSHGRGSEGCSGHWE